MKNVAIIFAVVLLIGLALFFWDRRDGGDESLPDEAVIDEPVAAAPVKVANIGIAVSEVRLLASGEVEVAWMIDPDDTEHADSVDLELFSEDGEVVASLGGISAHAGTHPIAGVLVSGDVLSAYASVLDVNGEGHSSDRKRIRYREATSEPLPVVENLRVEWRPLDGRSAIDIAWDPPASTSEVAAYAVLIDDLHPEVLLQKPDEGALLSTTSATAILRNPVAREITVAVTSVNRLMQHSRKTVAVVSVPAAAGVAPSGLEVDRDPDSASALRLGWSYESLPGLLGFRVFGHGLELANEEGLGADARLWLDEPIIAGLEYEYEVRAVFDNGLMSPLSERVHYVVEESAIDLAPPRPKGLVANWLRSDDGLGVALSWQAPDPLLAVSGYLVSWGPADANNFSAPHEIGPETTSYQLPVITSPGELEFRLLAVSAEGVESAPAIAFVSDPATLVAPARLIDYRVPSRDADGAVVEWLWRYADTVVVEGFRIYQDDVLVADEQQLGPEARSWTAARISTGGRYKFEIEAVYVGGGTTSRSPPQFFDFTPDSD